MFCSVLSQKEASTPAVYARPNAISRPSRAKPADRAIAISSVRPLQYIHTTQTNCVLNVSVSVRVCTPKPNQPSNNNNNKLVVCCVLCVSAYSVQSRLPLYSLYWASFQAAAKTKTSTQRYIQDRGNDRAFDSQHIFGPSSTHTHTHSYIYTQDVCIGCLCGVCRLSICI